MNGPPPTPAATCRLARRPIPFVQVWGVYQRPLASATLGEPAPVGHARGEDDVGLVDVERVGGEGGFELAICPGHLAAGDPDPGHGRAQRGEPGQVGAVEWLLDPEHVEIGRRSAIERRRREVDRRAHVAGHPPALVEVDHDRHRVADGLAGRAHGSDPILEPVADRPGSSARGSPRRGVGARSRRARRRQEHAARGVGRDSVERAAEERRDG